MCLIHDESQHYIYQNIMEAFRQSKMLSLEFMRRVGSYLCTCAKEFYIDSKTIIKTQQNLYEWFYNQIEDPKSPNMKLKYFKPIIENNIRYNGKIDSGTKVAFMKLLRDLSQYNYSKLRFTPKPPRRLFLMKQIHIKFDLKLCSFKEFCDSLNNLDNCAIKYIEHIHDCRVFIRDKYDLSLKHFMGEIDATIEGANMRDINRAEICIKRLADAIHYRLMKKVPSAATNDGFLVNHFQILLQSPTTSTAEEEDNLPSPQLQQLPPLPVFNLKDELFGNKNNNNNKTNMMMTNNEKHETLKHIFNSTEDAYHKNLKAY